MTKGRQASGQHLLANALTALLEIQRLELLNEVRHVVDRAEVSRAVERHLRSDEEVDDGERVQRRHVARHHTRTGGPVMNLNRAHAFENFSFMLVRVMSEDEAI